MAYGMLNRLKLGVRRSGLRRPGAPQNMSSPISNTIPVTQSLPGFAESRSLMSRGLQKLGRMTASTHKLCRSLVARTIYSLPPFAARNPRGLVRVASTLCERVGSAEDLHAKDAGYLAIRQGEMLTRAPSICLDEEEAAKFSNSTLNYQGGSTFQCPEVFVASFKRARVEGRDGIITTPDGGIVFESALNQISTLEKNGIFDRVLPSQTEQLRGRYCHFIHPAAHCYYHWMIEQLPKIAILSQLRGLGPYSFLLPKTLHRFQKASLEIAGISGGSCTGMPSERVEVEQLLFAEMNAPTGHPSPAAVEWLRKTFLRGLSPLSGSRRLFLSRRDAPQRRVTNEEEIAQRLTVLGFEVMCAGEMSIAEQVEVFRNAQIIIAPHGAALTNMVFAPPGTQIVELFGDNYINGCYWALANVCRQKHAFVTAPTNTLDYHMPVERFDRLLAMLGIN